MDNEEVITYVKQIFALLLLYIAVLLPFIYANPKQAIMSCDKSYICTVKITYPYFINQRSSFLINKDCNLFFVCPEWWARSYDFEKDEPIDVHGSTFINVRGPGVNADPFGTRQFCDYGEKEKIKNNEEKFKKYINNPEQNFIIGIKYNTKNFNIFSGGLTLILFLLALMKRPIDPIVFILRMIFTIR